MTIQISASKQRNACRYVLAATVTLYLAYGAAVSAAKKKWSPNARRTRKKDARLEENLCASPLTAACVPSATNGQRTSRSHASARHSHASNEVTIKVIDSSDRFSCRCTNYLFITRNLDDVPLRLGPHGRIASCSTGSLV